MESKPVGPLHLLALDHKIADPNIKYQGIIKSRSLVSLLPNELPSTIFEAGYLSSFDHMLGDMRCISDHRTVARYFVFWPTVVGYATHY